MKDLGNTSSKKPSPAKSEDLGVLSYKQADCGKETPDRLPRCFHLTTTSMLAKCSQTTENKEACGYPVESSAFEAVQDEGRQRTWRDRTCFPQDRPQTFSVSSTNDNGSFPTRLPPVLGPEQLSVGLFPDGACPAPEGRCDL